jgi:Flp pilus assembly protein TadG
MFRHRRLPSERGAAMVETIIVLPVVLLVMFAIVELSRAWFTAQLTTTAVREAVRVAAVALPADVSTAGNARLSQVLAAGNMNTCPQPPPASCVVSAAVTMQPIAGLPGTTDSEVVATATVEFKTLFANLLPASLQALNITQTAVMRHEGGPPAP